MSSHLTGHLKLPVHAEECEEEHGASQQTFRRAGPWRGLVSPDHTRPPFENCCADGYLFLLLHLSFSTNVTPSSLLGPSHPLPKSSSSDTVSLPTRMEPHVLRSRCSVHLQAQMIHSRHSRKDSSTNELYKSVFLGLYCIVKSLGRECAFKIPASQPIKSDSAPALYKAPRETPTAAKKHHWFKLLNPLW